MKLKDLILMNVIIVFAASYSMTRTTLSFFLYIIAVALSFYIHYLTIARENK